MNQLAEAYLRRSKWIIGVLLATNLLAGGIGIYALRRTNEEYSRLFDQTVPALSDLNRLMKEVSVVQRALRNWVDARTSEEGLHFRQQAADAEVKAKEYISKIVHEQQETVFESRVLQLEQSFNH